MLFYLNLLTQQNIWWYFLKKCLTFKSFIHNKPRWNLFFLNWYNYIKHNPSIFTKKNTFRITAGRCLESLALVYLSVVRDFADWLTFKANSEFYLGFFILNRAFPTLPANFQSASPPFLTAPAADFQPPVAALTSFPTLPANFSHRRPAAGFQPPAAEGGYHLRP